jgi:hypothetical protein
MIWTTTNNADASTDVHDKVLLAKGTWHYNAVDWAEPMSAAGSEHTVNADSVAVPFDACAPLTNTIVGMAIAQRGSCKVSTFPFNKKCFVVGGVSIRI